MIYLIIVLILLALSQVGQWILLQNIQNRMSKQDKLLNESIVNAANFVKRRKKKPIESRNI